MLPTAISTVTLYAPKIPLRHTIEHAAASRATADPLIVGLELQSGHIGFGETLPRVYVTGESHECVTRNIEHAFVPLLLQLRPQSFSEALEFIETLPTHDAQGQIMTAARAAIELGLLEIYARYFRRPIAQDVLNWLEMSHLQPAHGNRSLHVSGVIATEDPAKAVRSLRKMRLFGLRHFKLKVAGPRDDELVPRIVRQLGTKLDTRKYSLRLDANGGWTLEEAVERLHGWREFPITGIEQPLIRGDEMNLKILKERTGAYLIHDESLITEADARFLEGLKVADCYNIRISKCGGFIPALKLSHFCFQRNIDCMLGCMVGQSSLLSAVERRFLQCAGNLRFVESNYGRFLLKEDVTKPSLRFGFGGRLKPLPEIGWGINVDPHRLASMCPAPPSVLRL